MSIGAWRTRLSLQNHKRKSPFESYFQVRFEALRLTNPLVTYCTALIETLSTWSCRVCLFEWTPYRNKRDSVTLKLHFSLKLLYLLLWRVVLWQLQMTQIILLVVQHVYVIGLSILVVSPFSLIVYAFCLVTTKSRLILKNNTEAHWQK